MSFTQKQLRFTFSGAQSGSFSAQGLRAVASIQQFIGQLGVLAQVKVWGLSMAQMNAYSSSISAAVGIDKFNLSIEAGDVDGPLSQVVDAAIWRSFIDLTGAPESAFYVSCAGIYDAANPKPSKSWAGSQRVVDMLLAICTDAGFTLIDNGVTAVLRNMSVYGSAIQQIEAVVSAANVPWKIEGNTVYIWPSGQHVDNVVVDVGPDSGMVGYPGYWESGLIVTSIFNQQIQVGRQMKVTSSIPKANGTWRIIQVEHELATMMDKGPWFTTAKLAPIGNI